MTGKQLIELDCTRIQSSDDLKHFLQLSGSEKIMDLHSDIPIYKQAYTVLYE